MRTIFGYLFDGWRNTFFAFHLMVDSAMDCWGDDDDD